MLAAVLLLPGGEAGGPTPCRCPHHNRRPRGRRCAIALVETSGGRRFRRRPNGHEIAQGRYAVRLCQGFQPKPQARDTGRSSGDRLGRTLTRVVVASAAARRATVLVHLFPLFPAVSGLLHGHHIARIAPLQHHRTRQDLCPPDRDLPRSAPMDRVRPPIMRRMVEALNARPNAVLRWIDQRCPAGVMEGDSHKISAAALRSHGGDRRRGPAVLRACPPDV